MTLVSIVIAAYNCEGYLAQTLQSACSQTLQDLEVVVVDDGSKDGTRAVAESFPDRRVQVFSQANQGQCAASNAGCRLARGRYLKFLDADDLLNPQHLESQLNSISGTEDVLSCCTWGYFRKSLEGFSAYSEATDRDYDDPLEWLVDSLVRDQGMMGGWRWLIPRSVWDRCGGWNEKLSLNNDFDFSIRLLLASQGVRFAPEAVYYYRKGVAGALSATASRSGQESAWLTTLLGTDSLLARENSPRIRRICADRFQEWLFRFYPEFPDLTALCESRITQLGGSQRRLEGGRLLQLALPWLGWRRIRRLQVLVRKLGWWRIQNWKMQRRLQKFS